MPLHEHPLCIAPEPNLKVWRYMDFIKFFNLLQTSKLYLTRGDLFGDPYEGRYTDADLRSWEEAEGNGCVELSDTDPATGEPRTICHMPEIEFYPRMAQVNRRMTYLSCWHMNENESAAMWGLYASRNSGIAIETSVERLCAAIQKDSRNLFLTRVNYVDYGEVRLAEKDADGFNTFIHKRNSFAHENEARLIYWMAREWEKQQGRRLTPDGGLPETPEGIFFDVDLERLIERIWLAPTLQDWEAETLRKLIEGSGCPAEVRHSPLLRTPRRRDRVEEQEERREREDDRA